MTGALAFERLPEVFTVDATDPAHIAMAKRIGEELHRQYPHVSGWMVEGRGGAFKVYNKVLWAQRREKGRMGYVLHGDMLTSETDIKLAAREAGGTILEDYGVLR